MTMTRWLLLSVTMVVAAILMAVVLTPSLRQRIQDHFIPSGREILATAEGDLLNNHGMAKVLKYRDRDGIHLEILTLQPDGATTMVERIQLPDKHDGLFNFHGHVTRLAIADVDQDGQVELLAPTFDNQLVPHLNVFRYNPATAHFELVQPPAK
jgi:hypothetical protein